MVKKDTKRKYVIKWSSILGIGLVLMLLVNFLSLGTFSNIITMATGGYRYEIENNNMIIEDGATEYYTKTANSLDEAIANHESTLIPKTVTEGIVLLENDDALLPLLTSEVSPTKVTLFGHDSVEMVTGGSGSEKSSSELDMKTALESDSYLVNPSTWEASLSELSTYQRGEVNVVMGTADFNIGAFPSSIYNSCEDTYDEYNTAIYMVGRKGSESVEFPYDMGEVEAGDHGRHFFELSSIEEEMLQYITNHFDKVIVIINTSGNAFETQRITDILYNAKSKNDDFKSAMLFIGGTGSTGAYGIGDVLNGSVSPSGRLVDIWANDFTQNPAYLNFGNFIYQGMETKTSYVEYSEGIYVGYRYYETMNSLLNDGGKWYADSVDYPFGYGLSYTNFEQQLTNLSKDDSGITLEVTVTNTGDVSGKEVVQIYQTAPYTGLIEKSSKSLIAFDKTEELRPGESQVVTVYISYEDMASYDYIVEKAYILEAGTYTITVGKDSHSAYDEASYNVDNTIVYSGENKRSHDLISATNHFEDLNEYMNNVTTQLTRANNFEGGVSSFEEGRTVPDYISEYSGKTVADLLTYSNVLADYNYNSNIYDVDQPVYEKRSNIELIELRGLPYSHDLWDTLLDQLSEKEIRYLIDTGGYRTNGIESINKPETKDPDGPAGFTSIVFDTSIHGSAIPSETLIACTWNKDLVRELGEAIGEEGLLGGYSGWYAPGVNIHRSPFGGRNFEYYSEDPLLSGELLLNMVEGVASNGVYCYIKHFALNDQETNRDKNNGVATWVNEQALREIYLKPFEMAIKNAKMTITYLDQVADPETAEMSYKQHETEMAAATAIMSSFNRVGAVWAGGRYSLLTQVLREEWGFEGMVITDYFGPSHMNKEQMLRAGGDLVLTTTGRGDISMTSLEDQAVARRATKNILYTVVNSNAMNNFAKGTVQIELTPIWKIVLIIVDVIFAILWMAWTTIFILNITGKTKKEFLAASERE